MIIANFCKGDTIKTLYGLWQWDYGQVLRIQGLDLPTAVEIHFSLRDKGGEAVTRIGTTKDGVTDVVIPDSMLENNSSAADYMLFAFVYLTDETSGQTEYKICMQVKARPKPEAFDTPEDTELFREAIAAVNNSADRAEAAEKAAEGYANEANKDAEETAANRKEVERLVESVSGIGEDVKLVADYKQAAQTAAQDADTSAKAAQTAQTAAETAKLGVNSNRMYAVRMYEYATTLEEWKQWLEEHPMTLITEAAEEEFVPLQDSEQAALNALHSNYPTTVISNEQDCNMSLTYIADATNYINKAIQEAIQASIANNLLSANSTQALSAKMGAELNSRIEALEE